MASHLPSWDEYEAVLLLDGLLAVIQHDIPRNIVIEHVSKDLRNMAKNRGWEVNEKFRNIAGITFQLQSMESAYMGYTVHKPATKLFAKVADMYKSNYPQYNSLLKKAIMMAAEDESVELLSGKEFADVLPAASQMEKIDKMYNELKNAAPNEIPMSRTTCDKHLQGKYPIAFKRIFRKLQEYATDSKGIAVTDMVESIGRIATPAVVENILDNASWSTSKDDKYFFSRDIIFHINNYIEAMQNNASRERKAEIRKRQSESDTKDVAESSATYSVSHNPASEISRDAPKAVRGIAVQEEYAFILKEKFQKGFHMKSAVEIRKFRRWYGDIYGKKLEDSNEQIVQNINSICLLYDGKAYLPEVMLNDELKKSIFDYIYDSFANGRQVIYFQALYNKFAEAFIDTYIYNADMLRTYLLHSDAKKFCISQKYIAKNAYVKIDPLEEIRNCLKEYAQPMQYDDIFAALSHLPQSKIKSILRSNKEFVNNARGEYFHESIVSLSDEEMENIANIISYYIEDREFISGRELYNAVQEKYPDVIENNSFCSVYGFRDALKYKMSKRFPFRFLFNGNIISRNGQEELSPADVFSHYAKKHDSFEMTELQYFANELGISFTGSYLEAVYADALRISKDKFVSKNQAQFAVAEIDSVIDRTCLGNYIAISDITNFDIFPYAGFAWNSYLLESYVAAYSQKYMLLHTSYNTTKCVGAIVKRTAGIRTFDDLIVAVLVNSNIELIEEAALQFLVDSGYLARRKYSIQPLLIQARAQRNRRDTD